MARHCPECSFIVDHTARFCPKCGAFLGAGESSDEESATATYLIDEETGELRSVDVHAIAASGGALVIRAGGGLSGQSFGLSGERMTIGREPEANVFLDDVTVSRNHAMLVRRGSDWYLDDAGSLNGTYVNRHRVDSHRLEDGDEVQIGKFRLTYFAR